MLKPLISIVFVSLVSTLPVQAETFSLEYKGFHERMKRVFKGNFPQTELVFSVPKVAGCTIQSGNISTEKLEFPLTFNQQQRVFIPFDDELKNNRGLINIEVDGDGLNCAISMQIRVKQPRQHYTGEQLKVIVNEMDAMFDQLHGFPMKYFRQPLAGLTFQFNEQDSQVKLDEVKHKSVGGKNQITLAQIEQVQEVNFEHLPTIISPYLAK